MDYLQSGYSSRFATAEKERCQWTCPRRVGFNGKYFKCILLFTSISIFIIFTTYLKVHMQTKHISTNFLCPTSWRRELQTSYIWQCKRTSLLIFTVSTCSTLYTCREPREINSLTLRASAHFPSDNSLKVFRGCRTVAIYFVCNWLGYEMSGSFGTVWRRTVLSAFRREASSYLRGSWFSHIWIFISFLRWRQAAYYSETLLIWPVFTKYHNLSIGLAWVCKREVFP